LLFLRVHSLELLGVRNNLATAYRIYVDKATFLEFSSFVLTLVPAMVLC